MTFPSRFMIRSALVYMTAGAGLGMLLLLNKAWNFQGSLWSLLPVHIEMMLFGWIIQLTLGVAYWILPRYLSGNKRGNTLAANSMVWTLNAGILFVIAGSLTQKVSELKLVGRSFELLAMLIFISLHWKRIVTYNRS